MVEPRGQYTKGGKAGMEKQTPHDFMCVYDLKKSEIHRSREQKSDDQGLEPSG